MKEKKMQERWWEEEKIKIRSISMLRVRPTDTGVEYRTPSEPVLDTAEMGQQADTSFSERRDPSYEPPETPMTRRERWTLRPDPPITRPRARLQTQDLPVETQNGREN
jgi:hypothetical protein